MDIEEVFDELDNKGLSYDADQVTKWVSVIVWDINDEDIPVCVAGLLEKGLNLNEIKTVNYDTGDFTDWIEDEDSGFDGGYEVYLRTATVRYFGWNFGGSSITELQPKEVVTFEEVE